MILHLVTGRTGRLLGIGLLVVFIAAGALLVLPAVLAGPTAPPAVDRSSGVPVASKPLVRPAAHFDISPPLYTIPPRITKSSHEDEANDNPPLPKPHSVLPGSDSVLQQIFSPLVMPAPIQNFEGEYNQNGPIPPDPNGDVGRTQYVQTVNSTFQVWNKTGTSLYGPTNLSTLWTGFGGLCETLNSGDPVVNYDPMADRWVISQFTGQSNPTHQCIAVSTSPDATGAWYRYDFITSPVQTAFEDYPHMGVWPDAYYMTTNEFGTTNGGGNYAFERPRMIVGDPAARMIYFPSLDGGLLPSDLDGSILPPPGSPNYFWEWYNPNPGELAEYKFHVDWTTGTGTFTGPILISVTPFNYPTCGNARERCVPQPGTSAQLEVIGDRLMFRAAYRNFGGYESIVLNHTVNATGGNPGVAAPRWYELRDPSNALGATVFQQGTFYPGDGVFRWMGSIAQDRNADIAMGYSASSSTLFPSIRYAGRLPTDPLGTFGQGEATLMPGGGSEDFPSAPRWGDYSDLTVDPVDDCTFWYTQEYFAQTGLRNWRTRIGSFKFTQCTAQGSPTPVASATGTAPTATPIRPTQTPCAGSITYTDSMTNTDPTQTGRLGLSDPKSSCAVPKVVAALSDTLTRHYKSYNYTNTSGGSQCVTVSITQACGDNAIQSIAYLGSYIPASIQTNYLADGGAAGPSFSYSFTLGAGQTAVIVVAEVSPNLGCLAYTLSINPCGQGAITPTQTTTSTTTATTTSTATAIPPTSTATAVPPTLTSTAVPPTLTSTAVPPTLTSTAVPPTLTSTTVPPTLTRTAVPPTLTSTAVPPTLTRTAVPPTLTSTAVPPTLTRTAVPPTLTSTAVPPTLTRTAVPPTRTSTAVPPTLTRTAAPPTRTSTTVPPTLTRTTVPPTRTSTPQGTATATPQCPGGTPTRIPTPAFTPAPGCSTTPPDGVLTGLIIDHPNTTEAIFTNHSQTCSYPIGLAVYKRFDNNIEHQQLYDYRLAVIPPNSTLTLTVNNPSCAYQGDAFYGPLIESFAGGVRYGTRRLDDTLGHGHNYCTNQCNATPTPPR